MQRPGDEDLYLWITVIYSQDPVQLSSDHQYLVSPDMIIFLIVYLNTSSLGPCRINFQQAVRPGLALGELAASCRPLSLHNAASCPSFHNHYGLRAVRH